MLSMLFRRRACTRARARARVHVRVRKLAKCVSSGADVWCDMVWSALLLFAGLCVVLLLLATHELHGVQSVTVCNS